MKIRTLYKVCAAIGIAAMYPSAVLAATQFHAVFAPTDTLVKGPEKQFRGDICLNGLWQFQPVQLPSGFREGTDPAPELREPTEAGWDKIPLRVPSTWNANSFANHDGQGGDFRTFPSYPSGWESVKMGWLRRTVHVPAEWKGKRILLHFEAVSGDVRVLVNGKEAGRTFDIFFPFQLDVTNLIRYGQENEILLGVRKPELFDVKGHYGRREYQAGSFWGQHVVGPWQDVDLVALPTVHVSNVFVQPDVEKGLLKAEVTVHNDSDQPVQIELAGEVHRWTSLAPQDGVEAPEPRWKLEDRTDLQLKEKAITIAPHADASLTMQQKVERSLSLWSPEHPNLYGLIVDVKDARGVIDRKYQRFGWRQVTLSGSKVLLNGTPITLRGDSWHFLGVPEMTRRYAWAWFHAMHDANLNAVRLHAEPYPEFYLDVADEMGVMVLDETAIWASDGGPKLDSPKFWTDTNDHVAKLVLRDRNHPSVFGWSVANEVKPIVQSVFHGGPEMEKQLFDHYATWAEICRKLDPTRQWISADGDDDGGGKLPTYMVHYGGNAAMQRAAKSGKPWGVGEATGAYYATPEQSAKFNGERSYESAEGRMEGVAIDAYENLSSQREYGDSYRSVFNLVWYGLKPLPLGLPDTSRPPTLQDGVFFPPFVEGQSGMQPERLGPYSTTLNPGYDTSLPAYEPWPLFLAIKDANAEPPVKLPWNVAVGESSSSVSEVIHQEPSTTVGLLEGRGGTLRQSLMDAGVPKALLADGAAPKLLFVDGRTPPEINAKGKIDAVMEAGGTVVVWGVSKETLPQLNSLLPASLEITVRRSSSLLPVGSNSLTEGLKPSDMYFSESTPPTILDGGLDGPLVKQGQVLLQAANVDWLLWNKQPEYAKTGMLLRSERENKPSGAAVVEWKRNGGRLLVINVPSWSSVYKVQLFDRRLLENLGVSLNAQIDVGQPFLKNGVLARTLAAGYFPAKDVQEHMLVDLSHPERVTDGGRIQDLRWTTVVADAGVFDLMHSGLSNRTANGEAYLSFWIQSPRALDDLLIEPNVPKLDLNLDSPDSIEVFLDGKSLFQHGQGGSSVVSGMPLHRGWNHVLVRLDHASGDDHFSARLSCSEPGFLALLNSSLQKQ